MSVVVSVLVIPCSCCIQAEKVVESLVLNCSDPRNVEIFLIRDPGQPKLTMPNRSFIVPHEGHLQSVEESFKVLSRVALGRILMLWNGWAFMETRRWDQVVSRETPSFTAWIFGHGKSRVFPHVMPRRSVTLGGGGERSLSSTSSPLPSSSSSPSPPPSSSSHSSTLVSKARLELQRVSYVTSVPHDHVIVCGFARTMRRGRPGAPCKSKVPNINNLVFPKARMDQLDLDYLSQFSMNPVVFERNQRCRLMAWLSVLYEYGTFLVVGDEQQSHDDAIALSFEGTNRVYVPRQHHSSNRHNVFFGSFPTKTVDVVVVNLEDTPLGIGHAFLTRMYHEAASRIPGILIINNIHAKGAWDSIPDTDKEDISNVGDLLLGSGIVTFARQKVQLCF